MTVARGVLIALCVMKSITRRMFSTLEKLTLIGSPVLAWAAAAISLLAGPAAATADAADAAEANVCTQVRIYVPANFEQELVGARIVGGNRDLRNDHVVLGRITAPKAGWNTIRLDNAKVYRHVSLISAPFSYAIHLGEIEFLNADGKPLPGRWFDRSSNPDKPAKMVAALHDGDSATAYSFFTGGPGTSLVGVELPGECQCAQPSVQPYYGVMKGPISVTLKSVTPGAEIRYTTDGTPPTETNGAVYRGSPITISRTTSLAAVAFKAGMADSRPRTGTYRFGSSPPVVSLGLGHSAMDCLASQLVPLANSLNHEHKYVQCTVPGAGLSWLYQTTRERFVERFHKEPVINSACFVGHGSPEDMEYAEKWLTLLRKYHPECYVWLYNSYTDGWSTSISTATAANGVALQTTGDVFPARSYNEGATNVLYNWEESLRLLKRRGFQRVGVLPCSAVIARFLEWAEAGKIPGLSSSNYHELFPMDDGGHINAAGCELMGLAYTVAVFGDNPTGKTDLSLSLFTPEQVRKAQEAAWDVMSNYPLATLHPIYRDAGPRLAPPVVSPSPSAISGPTTVKFNSPTPGAQFRYTTNGQEPSPARGKLYLGSALVLPGQTLKVVAYKNQMTASRVVAAKYTDPKEIRIEFEDLKSSLSPGVAASRVDDPAASGGAYEHLEMKAAGDWAKFTFPAPAAGNYRVAIGVRKAPDCGQYVATLNGGDLYCGNRGTATMRDIYLYQDEGDTPCVEFFQGALWLRPGPNEILITVKGASGGKAMNVNLDYIRLSPLPRSRPPRAPNNLALGKPVASNTNAKTVGKLTDGDLIQVWFSDQKQPLPHWVEIDLGADVEIARTNARTNPEWAYYPRQMQFEVQARTAGGRYATIVPQYNYGFHNANQANVRIRFAPTRARYVRYVFSTPIQLSEIEVYGPAPGVPGSSTDGLHLDDHPNIVVILADDLGYGDVKCNYPAGKTPTPHLDRLASQGMRFTDAHAPSSLCSPTRYALLTGRYAWRTRLKAGVLWQYDKPLIEEQRLTLPAMLKQHGYRTAAVGKWHLGLNWPFSSAASARKIAKNRDSATCADIDWGKPIGGGPTDRGFDYYFGVNLPNFSPYAFIRNDRLVGPAPTREVPAMGGRLSQLPGPGQAGFDRKQVAPTLAKKACEWIEASAKTGKPFFLYLALTGPHSPIIPNDEFKGKSGSGDYGDWVMEMDWTAGEVVAALKRAGVGDNTLVIFTSDNGPEIWNYEEARDYKHYAMGPLRGVKQDTWEGGHRVPFIACWPGRIPAGATNAEVICHSDLMATVAAIVGAALPANAGEDSYNILPALFGRRLDKPLREATVHHSGIGSLAIRQGKWVFIDSKSGGVRAEPEWFKRERGYKDATNNFPGVLYDLSQDLAERRNLYGEHPDVARRLKALLEKYKRDGRSTPGPTQHNDVVVSDVAEGGDRMSE